MGPDQLTTPQPDQTVPPAPEGFNLPAPPQAPPPPSGFDFAQPPGNVPPPPAGFDLTDNPANPAKQEPITPEGIGSSVSNFWKGLTDKIAGDDPTTQQYIQGLTRPYQNVPGTAFVKGVTERAQADADAARLAGGTTLPQLYEEQKNKPQDEIDRLLGQKVSEGFGNPSWWGAQIAHGTGSMVPGLGAGMVGGLAGPMGAVAGFSAEGAIGTLVPAFIAAKQRGLDDDEATKAALVDSGISAATATAMGFAPQVSVFGKTTNPAVIDQVTETIKHPVMEALTQIGLIQPTLATAGHAATSLSHGEVPGLDDLGTTFAVGVGMGGVPVGLHATVRGAEAFKRAQVPVEPVASPEVVQRSFENQNPKPTEGQVVPPPPEGYDFAETDPEAKIFYSPVLRAARERLPPSASAEQIIATLRNTPGVKEEELLDLNLPNWLADRNGKVNKDDLIAHIESNAVKLEEVQHREELPPEKRYALEDWHTAMEAKYGPRYQSRMNPEDRAIGDQLQEEIDRFRSQHPSTQYAAQVMPGEHSNYREFVLKTPERGQRIVEDNPLYDPNAPRGLEDPTREQIDPSLNYTDPPHFEGNINQIAHVRTTDRTDRDGRRLLHIEEIQSDLHQRGRKQGYLGPGEKREDLNALEQRMDLARRDMDRFRDRNSVTHPRIDLHPDYVFFSRRLKEATDKFRAALGTQNKLPDLPFKTSWPELAIKRMLRLAADEGYDGISWINGDQIGLRQNTPEQLKGSREFYDKIVPSIFKKWAKKLGADVGSTRFPEAEYGIEDALNRIVTPQARQMRDTHYVNMGLGEGGYNSRNGYMTMNPAAGTRARMGFPLYETPPVGKRINDVVTQGLPKELEKPALKAAQVIRQLSRDMGITRNVRTVIEPTGRKERGYVEMDRQGRYVIRVNTDRLRTPEDLFATLAHEFGHIIQHNKFEKAPKEVQIGVYQDFENKGIKKLHRGGATVEELRRIRDNAISEMTGARNLQLADGSWQDQIPLSDLTKQSREYMQSFQEYFAEQVAKWATTSDRALSRVDKFYKELGKKIRNIIERFIGVRSKSEAEASPIMQRWLDSLVEQDSSWYSDLKDELTLRTKQANQEALDRDGTPEISAAPQTSTTGGGRGVLAGVGAGGSGPGLAMAAHGDRMNRFFEWMLSLPQIAELNKHIMPLQVYRETVALMNLIKNDIMRNADNTRRAWANIRDPKQQFALNKFIEDYANGRFKLPHTADGVFRRPNLEEFTKLAEKHGLSKQSLDVFNRVVKDFDGFLDRYREAMLADATKIKDPKQKAQKINDVNAAVDKLLQRPYFPMMRFGKYLITVYDSKGNIRHLEHTNSLRQQAKIVEALKKSPDLLPGDQVLPGEVPKDAMPLLGMPPGMLDKIDRELNLSATQRASLDQLRFDYAPSQSFRHQFRNFDVTPGYSTDFQRAYANFFFHGANHLTRVLFVDQLRDQVNALRDPLYRRMRENATALDKIANYLSEHMNMILDPKQDFAALRGIMFHWALGFNPSTATQNLTQTPLSTLPHLAARFGDLKALAQLTRSGTRVNNFYKKANMVEAAKEPSATPRMKAQAEAIKEGVLSETQAHTLAAVSEDRNLLRVFGDKRYEWWQKFSTASSWMFEMTEQYNRRVAFDASWELAYKDPNNKWVQERVQLNPLQYKRLRDQGYTHQEASAFIAAKDSVTKTQFDYAPYARPKFMRGKPGALFIFKNFTQNTLFNLASDPQMSWRALIILGAMGGMMGLPFAQNINDMVKNLAFKLFGKDFDLQDQVRKFVHDVIHDVIPADGLLHGAGHYGFGAPHVLNMLGAQMGIPAMVPTTEQSGQISMGNVLGFDPTAPLGPNKSPEKKELREIRNASGAGFGLGFAMYDFLKSSQDISDLKRWETIMPRMFANVSKAGRWAVEGGERNAAGDQILKFDVKDTLQAAEILARAAGYQPTRLSEKWDWISAKAEAKAFWQIRQGLLLRQFGETVKGNNPEDKVRVIEAVKKYNSELPQEARGFAITRQTLVNSVRQRMRAKAATEGNRETTRAGRVMEETMRKYFPAGQVPEGTTDVRPVR